MALSTKDALFARLASHRGSHVRHVDDACLYNEQPAEFRGQPAGREVSGPRRIWPFRAGAVGLGGHSTAVVRLAAIRGDEILLRARPAPAPERARDARRCLWLDRLRGEPRGLW